jgi:hypothetical protein
MMEFASLANFAATSNAASDTQVAALAEKKSALLTTLTAVMDKRDPAAMANSLAAATAVTTGTVTLSPSAGSALLDVVDGLVSASSSARSASVSNTQVRPSPLCCNVATEYRPCATMCCYACCCCASMGPADLTS